jgi:4a-hydroxytetrahydrobiopterin dehydratase
MKPSSAPKSISRTAVRNATLLNLLATPGLGSLVARRWFEGVCQILLSVAGFALVVVWCIRELIPYYGQMFNETPPQRIGFQMLGIGAAMFAIAWIWSLLTSLSLSRGVSQQEVESLKFFSAGQLKPDERQIQQALAALTNWQRQEKIITRTFQFKDFPAAMKFVDAVAQVAEQFQHHPDIDIRWNKVTLALTTHDAGGLTEKDFALARRCDALASS